MKRRDFIALAPASALAQTRPALSEAYRETAAKLIGAALADQGGWRKMMHLCDRIGHRLAGSTGLERAVEWCAAEMKREGLANVQTPLVKVPHWVRGKESATMLEPLASPIAMLGLGGSVGTPPEGITAEVVAVSSFDELEQLGADKVRGKIVLYDVPWQGYGRTVAYRGQGASRAAKLGALAALVRSVTPVSLRSPHTGAMNYAGDAPRIPAVAVSVEDSLRIHRLCESGQTVRVRLTMEAQMLPDADSANVIGEIPGREKPEEIVVMGGHIDSWDVGQGAQDDASGCVACWQAVLLAKQLGLKPRRTLRVCLWTNEENGLRGGAAYRQWAGATVKNHVAAVEMDGGAERPVGFGLSIGGASEEVMARALARMQQIGELLNGVGAGSMTAGGGGADIGALMRDGVPGIGHRTVGQRYFEWHHSEADTLDKIDPQEFRLSVAALAVLGFVLADMPERLAG
ncbi:MAG: M20/M25/M40 family metallo-hydrolase [Candidatus Solibacter usitatus]|nr:M20/M25/M40 family metallo-hydrolase [Candidatus Solibacter usitatus]